MKIAHMLPYSALFPLTKHNGRYQWALRLAKIQAADGHKVSVYAAPGSHGSSSIIWESITADTDNLQENNLNLIKTALQNDHDLYHSHFDYLHYLAADLTDKPVVVTQHWFPNEEIALAAKRNHSLNVIAVPSSVSMRRADQELGIKHAGIIRQGIDLVKFQPRECTINDRLIFVGRVAPWKGVFEAIQIAKATGQGLDIVGKLNRSEEEYWATIEPYVDGTQIRYLGPRDQDEVANLLAPAKAFLFPVRELEAAPQAPLEAQACGTPVIMSRVGATSEWLEPGKTGFLADSIDEYISALSKVDTLHRSDCRTFAENFDIKKLVKSYYELYQSLIRG